MPRSCQITPRFWSSLEEFLATHYFPGGRKGRNQKDKFLTFVEELNARIAANPEQFPEEPWPQGRLPIPGWSFRKAYAHYLPFRDPARAVRIVYLFNAEEVRIALFYTHEQFVVGRPPEESLDTLLDNLFGPES